MVRKQKPEQIRRAPSEFTPFGGLTRSQLMSKVSSRGNKTTEEKMVSLLRRYGPVGWRRHQPIGGRPDFVWRKERVALFVDGCFWHGHDCGRNLMPQTNADFWRMKIKRNQDRDQEISQFLLAKGWTVIRIWECHLRTNPEACVRKVMEAVENQGKATVKG